MEIKHILGLVTLLLFFVYFLAGNLSRKSYLLFILYFLPFLDLSVTSEEFGSITIFDALSYFILLFLIKDFFNSKYNQFYLFLFSSLVLLMFFGCVYSDFIKNSFFNLLKFISVFIYAKLLIDEFFSNKKFFGLAINALKFSCLFSIAFLVIQLIIGLKFTFYTDLNPNIFDGYVIRYPSFFQDPQMFAQFLSMTSFLFLVKGEGHSKIGLKNLLGFVLVVIVLFSTGGRSGLLGLCAGLLLILFFSQNRFRFLIVGCGILGYLVVSNFPEYFSMLNRQEGISDAYEVRNAIWKEAYRVFASSPFMGIGIGNYLNHIMKYTQSGYYVIDGEIVYYGAESGYLKMLSEVGMIGFIIVFSFIIRPLILGVRMCFKRINTSTITFLIASILSWLIAFISLNTLSDKRTQIVLSTVVCLLIVSIKKAKQVNEL